MCPSITPPVRWTVGSSAGRVVDTLTSLRQSTREEVAHTASVGRRQAAKKREAALPKLKDAAGPSGNEQRKRKAPEADAQTPVGRKRKQRTAKQGAGGSAAAGVQAGPPAV